MSFPIPRTLLEPVLGACLGILMLLGAGCGSSSDRSGQSDRSDGSDRSGLAVRSPEAAQPTERPSWLTVTNLRTTVYRGTSVERVVKAATARLDQGGDQGRVAVLEEIETTMYDGENWTALMKSRKGEMFLKDAPERGCSKNDLIFSGGVRVKTRQGLLLFVPTVHYFSKEERLVSSGGSFELRRPIEGGTWTCTGGWFEANKDLTRFTGHKNVRARSVLTPERAARPQ